MNPRVEYEMTEADLALILEACKPTPVMFGSGGVPLFRSQQENANSAWADLGARMGFDPMTVRPIQGKGTRFFTAVPSETDEQRTERREREERAQRSTRIDVLDEQIASATKERDALIIKQHERAD